MDETEVVLTLTTIIILIAFFGYLLYLLISSNFQTTNPNTNNRVSSDNRGQTVFECGIGQCATSLQSGLKRCPEVNQRITYDPSSEVCNSRFVCDNPITPFALLSSNATDINGVCEPNVTCPCLTVSQCASYVLSAFTVSNGTAYQNLSGQRITFPQISNYVSGGTRLDTPPIQFNNPATTFCAANLSILPLANPGCNFVNSSVPNSMTYEDLLLCMGAQSGCNNIDNSPCLRGTLALITGNVDEVTRNNIQNYQYSCVTGKSCPCDSIAIFDTNYGGIICKQLLA